MKKKKIVEIVSGLNYGGVENLLFNYLKHLNFNKYSITIITHDIPNENYILCFKKLNIDIINVTPKRKSIVKNYIEIKRILNRIRPDIVHCHMSLSNYVSLLISKKINVPYRIAHSHEVENKNHPINIIKRFIINKSANIFLASSIDSSISSYGDKRAFILPNSIDVDLFKYNESMRKILRSKYNISQSDIVIGTVGRLVEVKNHSRIIRILSNMNNKNIKLVIIGDGPLKKELRNYSNSINNKVIFIDNVSNIYDYYNMFDIYIQPSLSEGFGMTILEAQANGLPCVISSTIPSEVILNNNVCVLDLKDSDSIWIDAIISSSGRRVVDGYISKSNYNINNSYLLLDNLYTKGGN